MAMVIFSFKRFPDGGIMFHGFMRPAKHTAEADMKAHAGGCPDFGPAFRAGDTIEFSREVDYLPDFEGDALEEWLDELLAGEGDEAEDEAIDIAGGPEE
jgi:hypothetical protein